jgi:hypothetical protein
MLVTKSSDKDPGPSMYLFYPLNVELNPICYLLPLLGAHDFLYVSRIRVNCVYFLSSYWPSFRFLSFVAFLIPYIQFFFGLPRALFCFGIHFNTILGNLPSAILWTWPYLVSRFCSISFIIVFSSPICCLIVIFLILYFLDIVEDLLRTFISVASTPLLLFSVSLHVSEPYNKRVPTHIQAHKCIHPAASYTNHFPKSEEPG